MHMYLIEEVDLYVAKKFTNAKQAFVYSCAEKNGGIPKDWNLGGIIHEHMAGTYYFIVCDYYKKLELKKWGIL